MQQSLKYTLLVIVFALGSWSQWQAGEATTFERVHSHYENIRLTLLHDGLDNVADDAGHIHALSQQLEKDFSERLAGIRPAGAEELRNLLPVIRDASTQLSKAGRISEAREFFGVLSNAMVQYRRLVDDTALKVAFCPMARAFWLEPSGEIGNPYYGQRMARCGEFVSD